MNLTVPFLTSISVLVFSASSFAQVTPPKQGLLVDLNADHGVVIAENNKVESWKNDVPTPKLETFEKQDKGRKIAGSGRPELKKKLKEINGHNSIAFVKQELYNQDEDATDSLIIGSGFTWVVILKPYHQTGELKEVNTFFGNLKNSGNYEGVWGNLADDNRVWTGGRNGITFGRWDPNNPFIATTQKLDSNRFYLLAGRMESGTDTALTEIFINDFSVKAATGYFPVNSKANSSKLAVGEERDATNHPGVEAFRGEMARFLLYKRPLTNKELQALGAQLKKEYRIR